MCTVVGEVSFSKKCVNREGWVSVGPSRFVSLTMVECSLLGNGGSLLLLTVVGNTL